MLLAAIILALMVALALMPQAPMQILLVMVWGMMALGVLWAIVKPLL